MQSGKKRTARRRRRSVERHVDCALAAAGVRRSVSANLSQYYPSAALLGCFREELYEIHESRDRHRRAARMQCPGIEYCQDILLLLFAV